MKVLIDRETLPLPPHHAQRVVNLINNISYRDWAINIGVFSSGYLYIQVVFWEVDNNLPETERETAPRQMQKSGKWYISPHATDSEIVNRIFLAIKQAEEHEMREVCC